MNGSLFGLATIRTRREGVKTTDRELVPFISLFVALMPLVFVVPAGGWPTAAQVQPAGVAPDRVQMTARLQGTPLMFIETVGQFAKGARFQVRGGRGSIWLAEDAIWVTVVERPRSTLLPPPLSHIWREEGLARRAGGEVRAYAASTFIG